MSEADWSVYGGHVPGTANALRFVIEKCCELSRQRTAPKSRAEWQTRAPRLRQELAEALGLSPLPERTPLNARVVGRAEREDYVIENILFESRPRFYVTANLYLPKGVEFPTAAVVVAMGHAMQDGKNYHLYQEGQVALVRQGFVVLGYDPIGQGERNRPGMTHNMGYASLLVGRTNAGMMVWDTMRALDYLVTRPEVDPSRLGITGNSGGGLNTFYAMPLDDRLRAGASCCFVCSYEEWIRHGGNHCICNHMPGMARRMEEFEIVGLVAPRPFLFLNGSKDPIFPIQGARSTAERAGQVYTLQDAADRVRLVDFPFPHGWAQPLREASVGWLAHHLLGKGDGGPIPEAPFTPEDPKSKDLLCFDEGACPEDAETVVSLNRERAQELSAGYSTPPHTPREWTQRATRLRAELWRVLGGKPEDFSPQLQQVDFFTWRGATVTKMRLTTEAGMEVPGLLLRSQQASPSGRAVVYVDEKDKASVREWEALSPVLQSGALVFALDPRGLGEVHCHDNHLASDCIHLGRPLFAQQLWDVIQAVDAVSGLEGVERVGVYGRGAAGLLALFAGALSDQVASVVADGCLASYRYAFENDQPQPLWVFVPNLLRVADVPQVAALCAPRPVVVSSAVGHERRALSTEAVRQALLFTDHVYRLLGAKSKWHTTDGVSLSPVLLD